MADVVSQDTRGTTYADITGLQPWVIEQLNQLKIHQPTPIQYHCIQPALEGRDVIGAAKTGSGKTLAFVIPILQQLSIDPYGIYALVLTPTRELAFQIADQFRGLGSPVSLRLTVIIGGLDRVAQGAELNRSPHVVVATPGRLADILETSPEFTLKRIKFLVLDEADRLMDGRFDTQLRTIWAALPEKRQTLLFSATVTDRLQRMKQLATSEVFLWQSTNKQATVQQLDERYALVNPIVKDATMIATVLQHTEEKPRGLILIFTNTCKSTQVLSMLLNSLGIECVALHSMMPQKERLSALARFKSSQVKVLIATDVASRGLDIPLVELVINHTIPNLPKNYIHRVGRTARAGRAGQAVSFITPHEIKILLAIEAETRQKMTELKMDEAVVRKIMKQVNVTRREQEIKLNQTDFDERRNINKRKRLIMEGRDPDEEEKKKQKRVKKLRKAERKERIQLIEELEKKKKKRQAGKGSHISEGVADEKIKEPKSPIK
ncbi:probable ATP-dependent RNA helicase DDX49 [Homarus americanus]|uniref:probable ATP-dependent RNA helicase DDX49 n=1 Tax=Homarus americanus TaxID=6706 RepID=UPI001C493A58|nr:probable ATP-dependent RNA helicase DDX49 [Homarus americanus]